MTKYSQYSATNPILKSGVMHLTSDYKTRNKKRPGHNGMDFTSLNSSHTGMTCDYIVAMDKGTVSSTGYDSKSGYYVFVKHENGYKTFYCHLKKGSIKVKKGQKVSKGQVLAYMGNSGASNGAHAHVGVKNTKGNWVDPQPYLKGTKSFDKPTESWEKGDYITTAKKFLRKTPKVADNKVKYSVLTASAKLKCDNVGGYARYKKGIIINIKEFKTDSSGNVWGRTSTTWVCVQDKTGKQVKKQK